VNGAPPPRDSPVPIVSPLSLLKAMLNGTKLLAASNGVAAVFYELAPCFRNRDGSWAGRKMARRTPGKVKEGGVGTGEWCATPSRFTRPHCLPGTTGPFLSLPLPWPPGRPLHRCRGYPLNGAPPVPWSSSTAVSAQKTICFLKRPVCVFIF